MPQLRSVSTGHPAANYPANQQQPATGLGASAKPSAGTDPSATQQQASAGPGARVHPAGPGPVSPLEGPPLLLWTPGARCRRPLGFHLVPLDQFQPSGAPHCPSTPRDPSASSPLGSSQCPWARFAPRVPCTAPPDPHTLVPPALQHLLRAPGCPPWLSRRRDARPSPRPVPGPSLEPSPGLQCKHWTAGQALDCEVQLFLRRRTFCVLHSPPPSHIPPTPTPGLPHTHGGRPADLSPPSGVLCDHKGERHRIHNNARMC